MIEELLSLPETLPSEAPLTAEQTQPDLSTYRDQESRQSKGYRGLLRKREWCSNYTYIAETQSKAVRNRPIAELILRYDGIRRCHGHERHY
jgi:hypothetical protein